MIDWTPHVTVATLVESDGKFLLVEERINNRNVLNQPAGHVEANESLPQAAIRETLEETGWHVKPTALLGLYSYTTHCKTMTFYRTAFIAEAIQFNDSHPIDPAILRTHWLTFDEIQSSMTRLRSPIVLKCVEDFCVGKSYPLNTITELCE